MGNSYTLEMEADINDTIKFLDPATSTNRTFRMSNGYWTNNTVVYTYDQGGPTNFVRLNLWRNLEYYPFSFHGYFQKMDKNFFILPQISSLSAEIESFRYRGVYTGSSGQIRTPWLPCFTGLYQPLALSYTENLNFYSLTAMSFEIKYKTESLTAGFMSKLYSMLPFTGNSEKIEDNNEDNNVNENTEEKKENTEENYS